MKRQTDYDRRAAYLWVFWQPGLFGFAYMGWWLYIRTLKGDYGLGFHTLQENFVLEIMQQFPCGILPMRENFDAWKEAFAKTYRRPGRFKRQGLVMGWVDLKYGRPVGFTPVQGRENATNEIRSKSRPAEGSRARPRLNKSA